jgi:hypothetical protein
MGQLKIFFDMIKFEHADFVLPFDLYIISVFTP